MHRIKLSYLLNTGFIYLFFFCIIIIYFIIFENKSKSLCCYESILIIFLIHYYNTTDLLAYQFRDMLIQFNNLIIYDLYIYHLYKNKENVIFYIYKKI